jgi:hypothetical protein
MGKRGRESVQSEGNDPTERDTKAKKASEVFGQQDVSEADKGSADGGGMYPRSELRHPPATSGQFIKIITWNVAGLRGTLKKSPKILEQLAEVRLVIEICR